MPEARLARTQKAYEAYEECLVHVPPCVRVDGEWRRQLKTAVSDDGVTWRYEYRPVMPHDEAYGKQSYGSFEGHSMN